MLVNNEVIKDFKLVDMRNGLKEESLAMKWTVSKVEHAEIKDDILKEIVSLLKKRQEASTINQDILRKFIREFDNFEYHQRLLEEYKDKYIKQEDEVKKKYRAYEKEIEELKKYWSKEKDNLLSNIKKLKSTIEVNANELQRTQEQLLKKDKENYELMKVKEELLKECKLDIAFNIIEDRQIITPQELNKLHEDKTKLMKDNESLKKENKELKMMKEKLKRNLREERESYEKERSNYEEVSKDQQRTLNKEQTFLLKNKERLEHELSIKCDIINKLEHEKEAISISFAQIKQAHTTLNEEVNTVKQEVKMIEGEKEEALAKIKTLSKKCIKLEKESKKNEKNIDEQQQTIKELQNTLDTKEFNISILSKKTSKLEILLKNREIKLANARSALKDLRTRVVPNLKDEIANQEKKLSTMEKIIEYKNPEMNVKDKERKLSLGKLRSIRKEATNQYIKQELGDIEHDKNTLINIHTISNNLLMNTSTVDYRREYKKQFENYLNTIQGQDHKNNSSNIHRVLHFYGNRRRNNGLVHMKNIHPDIKEIIKQTVSNRRNTSFDTIIN